MHIVHLLLPIYYLKCLIQISNPIVSRNTTYIAVSYCFKYFEPPFITAYFISLFREA